MNDVATASSGRYGLHVALERKLTQIFGDLAVQLQSESGGEKTLRIISEAAAEIVPGARWAGISKVEGKRVIPEVPTDPIVVELDRTQSELDDGPCLDALRRHYTVHIDDMAADQRWPRFAQRAVELGVHSLLSFQLFVQSETLGALNIYAGSPGVFGDDSIETGLVLAQHAAVAMIGSAAADNFRTAVFSRDLIGQAKGILMHRDRLSGVQAFAMLTRASQQTNIKLIEVARWLVAEQEASVAEPAPESEVVGSAEATSRRKAPSS